MNFDDGVVDINEGINIAAGSSVVSNVRGHQVKGVLGKVGQEPRGDGIKLADVTACRRPEERAQDRGCSFRCGAAYPYRRWSQRRRL